MHPKEFLLKIIDAYQEARLTSAEHPKIYRGRSHSISSKAEDYLAEYLVDTDASIDRIYVDQPISLPAKTVGNAKAIQRYPDLVIVRNDTIEMLIDLKMDLGWARSKMKEFCIKHDATLALFAGRTGRLKDGRTKEVRNYAFSQNLRYVIAVISGQNINQAKLYAQLEDVKMFEPRVRVLILSNDIHPNSYETDPEETLSKMTISISDFKHLASSE